MKIYKTCFIFLNAMLLCFSNVLIAQINYNDNTQTELDSVIKIIGKEIINKQVSLDKLYCYGCQLDTLIKSQKINKVQIRTVFRNEKQETDYNIIRSSSKFAVSGNFIIIADKKNNKEYFNLNSLTYYTVFNNTLIIYLSLLYY